MNRGFVVFSATFYLDFIYILIKLFSEAYTTTSIFITYQYDNLVSERRKVSDLYLHWVQTEKGDLPVQPAPEHSWLLPEE